MAIKLVDLLVERITELSNTDPVLDEYIPNPKTGKSVKVRSALSSAQHPAYQAAKQYIKGKMTDEPTAKGPPPSSEPKPKPKKDTSKKRPTKRQIKSKLKGFKDKERKAAAFENLVSVQDSIDKVGAITGLVKDKEKWGELSDDSKKAAVVSYRNETRESHEKLISVKDDFIKEGIEVPEDIEQGIQDRESEIKNIEAQEAQESEQDSSEGGEGRSWTDLFAPDDDALKQFDDILGYEDTESAVQFRA